MIRVAGIDPSLQSTGVATYTDGRFLPYRIQELRRKGAARLCSIRDRVCTVIEGYSYGSEGRWYDLGELGGVLRVALFERGIPYLVVPPSSLKRFTAGNGHATKEAMMRAVASYYAVSTSIDDEADAVALARFAYVYETGDSVRRCELETVKRMKEGKTKNPTTTTVKVPVVLEEM